MRLLSVSQFKLTEKWKKLVLEKFSLYWTSSAQRIPTRSARYHTGQTGQHITETNKTSLSHLKLKNMKLNKKNETLQNAQLWVERITRHSWNVDQSILRHVANNKQTITLSVSVSFSSWWLFYLYHNF